MDKRKRKPTRSSIQDEFLENPPQTSEEMAIRTLDRILNDHALRKRLSELIAKDMATFRKRFKRNNHSPKHA